MQQSFRDGSSDRTGRMRMFYLSFPSKLDEVVAGKGDWPIEVCVDERISKGRDIEGTRHRRRT
jgi:hypothetical protein